MWTDPESTLARGLRGLREFFAFGIGFEELLASLPISLASACWHLHGYWFGQMRTKLRTNLEAAISNLADWKDADGEGLARLSRAIADLTSETYERPLATVASHLGVDWHGFGHQD